MRAHLPARQVNVINSSSSGRCSPVNHCPCTCRLLEQLRQHPETQDFVYLRRVISNPSLYNPYNLEVHLLPPSGTQHAYCLS